MKQYNKTNWKDRIVQFPNRYKDQDNNIITLTQDPGEVAQDGTLVEAEKMNNIENGIEESLKIEILDILLLYSWLTGLKTLVQDTTNMI